MMTPAAPSSSILPGISIIVPAYNAAETIRPLLDSLLHLDYPREQMEIIIVDNGSTDRTVEYIRANPVTLLEETSTRSSYAARNLGLQKARHEIIAFTDADCTVAPSWLREGVRALEGAEIAAGRVQFSFSPTPKAAELFDSLHHMRNDELIRKYSGAATANLFVRRELFRKLGPFRADVRSGGDMMWTRAATAAGHRLVFAPQAVVHHPSRGLRELLAKGFRLGTGIYRMHRDKGIGTGPILYEGLRALFPPKPGRVRKTIHDHGGSEYQGRTAAIWWTGYLYAAARGLGLLSRLIGLTGRQTTMPGG
jgi:glycosyltransferase involved in cell wall biosynthesis